MNNSQPCGLKDSTPDDHDVIAAIDLVGLARPLGAETRFTPLTARKTPQSSR